VGAAFFAEKFSTMLPALLLYAVSEDAVAGCSRFLHRSRGWTRLVPPAVVPVHNCALGMVTAKPTRQGVFW